MIRYTTGNILEAKTDALVNTVNCEGYMGKGIAYQFKARYPKNNEAYVKACRSGILRVGVLLTNKEEDRVIINFPTKTEWRKKSSYDYIEKGMEALVQEIPKLNVKSIAIPPLGCGNGGLEWNKVRKILEDGLSKISDLYEIYLYEPSKYYNANTVKKPPRINSSHLLLMRVKTNLKKFNKIRLQKTAYMINYFSNSNYFMFQAYKYGPYAHSIDVISREIREFQKYHGVTTSEAIEIAKSILISDSIIKKQKYFTDYLRKALKFVDSITIDQELELLTTLLFIIERDYPITLDKILDSLEKWPTNKQIRFNVDRIQAGLKKLQDNNVVDMSLLGYCPIRE